LWLTPLPDGGDDAAAVSADTCARSAAFSRKAAWRSCAWSAVSSVAASCHAFLTIDAVY
jgi:hypothetical protein